MQYFLIQFECGTSLLQEVYQGNVQRYCDFSGVTQDMPSGGSAYVRELSLAELTFIPPPDPVPPPPPVDTGTPIPVAAVVTPPVTYDMVGAPIRTFGYDDKGQIVRIDYPNTGVYQMLEYSDGRLRKITEISPTGVQYERHFYYDNWGRFNEETQL